MEALLDFREWAEAIGHYYAVERVNSYLKALEGIDHATLLAKVREAAHGRTAQQE